MKILIDMNLSPYWTAVFNKQGDDAVHWSEVGAVTAKDEEILSWAAEQGYVVFTHDLDFGTLLATQERKTPSVIQLRGQEVTPDRMADVLLLTIRQFASELASGALITIDSKNARVRILPIKPQAESK